MKILQIIVVSALICATIRWLFPRRGAWLPVLFSVVLPPLVIVPLTIFSMLADIGASTPDGASAPPGTVDKFAEGLNDLWTYAALWIVVGGATAAIILRLHKHLAGRP